MKQVELESFPLTGMRLIEASAGTGKTYTITALYLRLLLEKKLTADQILVVTFTEAATEELRGRIRERIYQAINYLVKGLAVDPPLEILLSAYKDDAEAICHLSDVLISMDEAAIYTIHGFCQRMLIENAFESGIQFEATFLTDEKQLRQDLVRDFWRSHFVDLDAQETSYIRQLWQTPELLASAITPLLNYPMAERIPEVSQQEALINLRLQLVQELGQQWQVEQASLIGLLETHTSLSRKKATWKKDNLDQAVQALKSFFEAHIIPVILPDNFELFTAKMLADPKELKGKKEPLVHSFFDLAQQVFDVSTSITLLAKAKILNDAATYINVELEKYKQDAAVLFFDDLLKQLDKALSGEQQSRLIERIRKRYPAAMIDEFQDTDPLQYRIFNKLYQNAPTQSLFMIGDPKQAIYSFRGADIFTYMQARHSTNAGTDHFTLDTNYRSHSQYVESVNRLFLNNKAPFIYDDDIIFSPAKAAGKADKNELILNNQVAPPLVAWMVARTDSNKFRGSITKKWAMHHVAARCAEEIMVLLKLADDAKAFIGENKLIAKDIAILVRDRFEATAMQKALSVLSLDSVFISRNSIFETVEAIDLTHLLRAIIEPEKATLLRTALASRLWGWNSQKISELNRDEAAWEQRLLAFQQYRTVWSEQGFIVMFMQLLREEGIYQSVLSRTDGDRCMTNLLQLAELAQKAEQKKPGMENLLAWLIAHRANPDGDQEEQQLRLDSDEDLLKIVTIHKSKGLEYPIVFLPFIWSSKITKAKDVFAFHDVHTNKLKLDLGSDQREYHLALADKERLAEDLRLLYVALTRAKYQCYFSWGQFSGAKDSAMAWLLHRSSDDASKSSMGDLNDEQILDDLVRLNKESEIISIKMIEHAPEIGESQDRSQFTVKPLTAVKALQFGRRLQRQFSTTSFTALTVSASIVDLRVDSPDYDALPSSQVESVDQNNQLTQFTFPRGATAGECLHGILESIDFQMTEILDLELIVKQKLAQYGFDEKWQQLVVNWLLHIVKTPLNIDTSLSLEKISHNDCLKEMEFHFPIKKLTAQALNQLRGKSSLSFVALQGVMKGFIDLIFEYQGRFYILDYKSNYLGDKLESYQAHSMQQAMDEHHYDLQYQIYTVALHRYLKQRVVGYDYAQHFGGVYYLFLRGMHPDRDSGIYHTRPEQSFVEQLNDIFSGESYGDA